MWPFTRTPTAWAQAPIFTTAALDMMWGAYLGDSANADSPCATPVWAADLAGLPPTLILTVEADPTRDEAEAYAQTPTDAAVPTEINRFDGLIHCSAGSGRSRRSCPTGPRWARWGRPPWRRTPGARPRRAAARAGLPREIPAPRS
ncbi:MAG: alpha/beta hydrolase fold domain-containing protein [Pseudonocardia sp.]|uniref:alpha/beta hydrolase fold domain-containing protein n=1 Tax=Pseudonocardia sp. TaxID=60912 RepID=UPI001ACD98E1|nr:alpha/beta hydrolase fold domain-containing protein [Pseudonocardia sp.]MBN9098235.1 alpha/beta hydrolase fold domain-containing protein [Pseudonocardia sp.]